MLSQLPRQPFSELRPAKRPAFPAGAPRDQPRPAEPDALDDGAPWPAPPFRIRSPRSSIEGDWTNRYLNADSQKILYFLFQLPTKTITARVRCHIEALGNFRILTKVKRRTQPPWIRLYISLPHRRDVFHRPTSYKCQVFDFNTPKLLFFSGKKDI